MILLDLTSESTLLIGLQRSDKRYTYLHWKISEGLFQMSSYHTMIANNYKNISGIGPTMLVEWSDDLH